MGDVNLFLIPIALFLAAQTIFLGRISRALRRTNALVEATFRQVSATDLTIQRVETLYKLEGQIADKLKKLENPSVELREFLADMATHGCSILQISPDAIFIRGIRK